MKKALIGLLLFIPFGKLLPLALLALLIIGLVLILKTAIDEGKQL